MLEGPIRIFTSPHGSDIFKSGVGEERKDLEEIGDAGLIEHVVVDFGEVVGGGGHDFFACYCRFVREHNFGIGVGARFVHFLLGVLEVADAETGRKAHEFGLLRGDGGRQEDFLASAVVEAESEVAGEFEVLELVLADRDIFGGIKQDVGGHENGVVEDADVGGLFAAVTFFFVLDHAGGFAHGGGAV